MTMTMTLTSVPVCSEGADGLAKRAGGYEEEEGR